MHGCQLVKVFDSNKGKQFNMVIKSEFLRKTFVGEIFESNGKYPSVIILGRVAIYIIKNVSRLTIYCCFCFVTLLTIFCYYDIMILWVFRVFLWDRYLRYLGICSTVRSPVGHATSWAKVEISWLSYTWTRLYSGYFKYH